MTPCQGGCGRLVATPGTCSSCRRIGDHGRKNSYQRGYNGRWKRESRLFLRANPICVCDGQAQGCNGEATVTDHRIPHKGDPALFWDATNWQPMSKVCHDRKTATEDGAFGNPVLQPTTTKGDDDESMQSTGQQPAGTGLADPRAARREEAIDHRAADTTAALHHPTKQRGKR